MISASTDKEKARFGLTQKGKPLLIDHEWHHYTKDNTRGEREFWRCTSKATKGCPGRAVTVPTESNKVVFLSQNHNHPSDITHTKVLLLENAAVQRAVENPGVPPRRVLGDLAMQIQSSSEMAARAPATNLLRRIHYQRKKVNMEPKRPTDWEGLLQLPEKFTTTAGGSRFLLLNTISKIQPGILLFSSDWQLKILNDADSIAADGTFGTAPHPFCQILTVVANFHQTRKNYPVAFAFLPDKTTKSYSQVWASISEQVQKQPGAIRVDFELADIKAISQRFPQAVLEGCFVHFRSSIWRSLLAKNLVSFYNQNQTFQVHTKSLVALAFVPADKVIQYFELLQESKSKAWPSAVGELEHYFEATYLGLRWGKSGGRKKPLYPIQLWNQYNRAVARNDKTTNSVEAWNSAWSNAASPNSSLWTTIESLRREEALTRSKFMDRLKRSSIGSKNARKVRRAYSEERICNICLRIADLAPLDYLSALSQNFDLQ
jgi:hypothetical protein